MIWSAACGLEPMESDLCLIRKRFSFHLPKKAQTGRERETNRDYLRKRKPPKFRKIFSRYYLGGQ